MSISVMSWVWAHSKAEGADLLVMLAIADHAHDDGGQAYPSVRVLAGKARVSERTVQRCIRKLVESGELNVRAGAARKGANLYRVIMTTGDSVSPRQIDTPDIETPSESHPVTMSPVTSEAQGVTSTVQGVTPMSPEPSMNHQEPSRKALVAANAAPRPTERGTRLPDDWLPNSNLVAWAKAQGFTDETGRRETEKFGDYWRAQPGVKGRKTDWDGTWRNWMRNASSRRPTRQQETDDYFEKHAQRLGVTG